MSPFCLLCFVTSLMLSSGGEDAAYWSWVVFSTIVAFALLMAMVGISESRKHKKENDAARKSAEDRHKEQKELSDKCWNSTRRCFGEPTTVVSLDGSDWFWKQFIVYDEEETVCLAGLSYAFEEVLGYSMEDDKVTVGGNVVETVSSVDNGSMIGRAVLGKAVAGKAGAVIGGATARRRTRYVRDDVETVHDFMIFVKLDNMKHPMVKLRIGDDEDTALQVSALLDIIIRKNDARVKEGRLSKREQARKMEEELRQTLNEHSEEYKEQFFRIFGNPDRTISLDGSGLALSQIYVYDHLDFFFFNGEKYDFKQVLGYSVEKPVEDDDAEEGTQKCVVVKMYGDEDADLRLELDGDGSLMRELTGFLDDILQKNARQQSDGATALEAPKVDGLVFSEQCGDDKIQVFFDTIQDKAVVVFKRAAHDQQHIVGDFHEFITGVCNGRAWAMDAGRRKALYANGLDGSVKVYDYSATDNNVDCPSKVKFSFPVCSGMAISPDAREDDGRSEGMPAYFIPAFAMVEEATAFLTMFTDEGFEAFNYADGEANSKKRTSTVNIRNMGHYFLVTDEFNYKLVAVSPLHPHWVVDYQDILDVKYEESAVPGNPQSVSGMRLKITLLNGNPSSHCLELCHEGEVVDKQSDTYTRLKETAKEMETFLDGLVATPRKRTLKKPGSRGKQANKEERQEGRQTGMAASVADELLKLASLKEKGLLTDEEFTMQKRKLLGL